ncbi:serine--tRNA ligase [Candidatus Pacearchaeota archaeon]|nr:serine--tRNA ligase [Candidatus Pacearchaeota archaeon]
MIDIKLIRDNPELVKENMKKKFQEEKFVLVDNVRKLDEKWRALKYKEDNLRSERNKISQQINQTKKQKKDASALIKKAKEIPGKIEVLEKKRKKFEEEINQIMYKIPNIISKDVPMGKDESKNVEIKKVGRLRKFGFPVKGHVELGEKLRMLDFDASAKVSGKGFYYLKGDLALLNMALINFARDSLIGKGFEYIETPLMLREEIIKKVTDLHDQKNQIYKIEGEDLYLIGTSEHSLIGRFIDTTILEKNLPIKNTSYSMCFRKEIGSHGIDEKGIFRTHQFNKQEMIVICGASDSDSWYDKMLKYSIDILKALEIPIRVLEICSGDLGDLKHRQVDIEAWSPRQKKYYEVGSCSNLTDAQARKLNIKIENKGERSFPHTLNNTAIATSRVLVALMENNQQKDGSIKIPKVLWKYTGFKEIK